MTTHTQFERALNHYRQNRAEIIEAGRDEWGVDAYAWEEFNRMTPIEDFVWRAIRQVDAVLYPQYPIGWYYADFCNPVAGVVIECDGAKWHQDKERDRQRQERIEQEGFVVYRITGKQCQDEDFVLEFVRQIATRHRLVRGSNQFCVAWTGKVYVIGSHEEIANRNAAAALEGGEPVGIVRDGMTAEAAKRFAKAMSGVRLQTAGGKA